MYKSKRHVPSVAALKVLTQLAYISTGTALGVAALCAEERRRRIKIVQTLADNARVIRQHPRHRSNVAVAAKEDFEAGTEGFFGGERWSPDAARKKSRQLRGGRHDQFGGSDDGPVKGPTLPSVVEEGYTQTIARRHRVQDDTQAHIAAPFQPFGHPASGGRKQADVDYVRAEQNTTQPLMESGSRSYKNKAMTQSQVRKDNKPRHENDLQRVSVNYGSTSTAPNDDGGSQQDHDTIFRRFKREPNGAWSRRQASLSPDKTQALGSDEASPYLTKFAWRANTEASSREDARAQITSDQISDDVGLFFLLARQTPGVSDSKSSAGGSKIATHLLELALDKGSLREVRSLCFFLIKRKEIEQQTLLLVARSSLSLATRVDEDHLLAFYAELFATSVYGDNRRIDRLEHILLVLASFASTRPASDDLLSSITAQLLKDSAKDLTADEAIRGFQAACSYLIDIGRADLASGTLRLYTGYGKVLLPTLSSRQQLYALADSVIQGCITYGQLSAGGPILRWRYRNNASERLLSTSSLELIEDYIVACSSQNLWPILVKVFFSGRVEEAGHSFMHIAQRVNGNCRTILARACGQDVRNRERFKAIYNTLSPEQQQALRFHSSVSVVVAKWQSTHDLIAIEAEVSILKNWLKSEKDDQTARKLNDALLEIYIDAGQVEKAVDLLARLQSNSKIRDRPWFLAALLFAKKRAWDQIGHMLEAVNPHKLTTANFESIRIWDKIISLYSEDHTTAQTLHFVAKSVDTIGYVPSILIKRTVLSACVRSRSPELIPRWLDYLHSIGHGLELDSEAVVGMLTTYWIETRPKHRRLMWICHFLQRNISGLEAHSFRNLLQQAIAYDIRNPYTQDLNAGNTAQHAMERLARVRAAEDHVPIPGWTGLTGKNELTFMRKSGLFETDSAPTKDEDGLRELDANRAQTLQYASLRSSTKPPSSQIDHVDSLDGKTAAATFSPFLPDENPPVGANTENVGMHSPQSDWVDESQDADEEHSGRRHMDQNSADDVSVDDSADADVALHDGVGEDGLEPFNVSVDIEESIPQASRSVEVEDQYEALMEEYHTGASLHGNSSQAGGDAPDGVQTGEDASADLPGVHPDIGHSTSVAEAIQHLNPDYQKLREGEMVLALSSREYARVLHIYEDTLAASGLPASIRSLEIAIEAALRLHNSNPMEAENLILRVTRAGMNTAGAVGPLLVHRMRNMSRPDTVHANQLRVMVMDYYRMNDTNGRRVSHHIATKAAHVLVSNRYPEHAVNLLTAVYTSEWAARRPLDIVAMTTFLMAYIDLRSMAGVHWVVGYVLTNNLPVSRKFMRELKRSYTRPEDVQEAQRAGRKPRRLKVAFTTGAERCILEGWARKCYKRRLEQIDADFRLGVELEKVIRECAEKQAVERKALA